MIKKKRKNDSFIAIAILSLLVLVVYSLLFVNFSFIGKKSIHEDARRYQTRHCLAFYPDSKEGLNKAKELCKGVRDDSIHDYTLIPYGDYYLINYGGEYRYFTDGEFNPIKVEGISDSGKNIILDYLRYTFKKQYPERYYNADFLRSLNIDSINFEEIEFDIDGENLSCYLKDYDLSLEIPLKYVQKEIGMNFGFPYEIYSKPVYLSDGKEHPIICLTFDDGPKLWTDEDLTSTERILDLLYEYDAAGTFYVVGNALEDREIWADYQVYTMLKKSINHGNEYGSHTQSHLYALSELESEESILKEISGPIDYLKEFMNYEVKTYRPVEGKFNDLVLKAQPVGAVLWDVDSEDWESDNAQQIIDQVLKYDYESGDIILFHDIYNITAEALEKIIPALVNKGCQLVNVSTMLSYYGIEPSTLSYFYGPDYYE
ncbi:MAG: polysaccharide deacetylase family protein [Erysipelotrichaceae bacterium]|nr:polysaccharide deacetylase family protein [Erysipelotrichaceae bacterium]